MLVLCERLWRDDKKMREDSNVIVCLLLQIFVGGVRVFLRSLAVAECLFIFSFDCSWAAPERLFSHFLEGSEGREMAQNCCLKNN